MLADPALEARAREISKELRCLVCQNQSIDDSDAELARDLRVLVRERVTAGDSNEQVIDLRRLALRRLRPAEAAVQDVDLSALARPGGDPRHRPGRRRAVLSPPRERRRVPESPRR